MGNLTARRIKSIPDRKSGAGSDFLFVHRSLLKANRNVTMLPHQVIEECAAKKNAFNLLAWKCYKFGILLNLLSLNLESFEVKTKRRKQTR